MAETVLSQHQLWLGLGGNFKLKNLEGKKGFAAKVGIGSDGSYSTSALASLLGVGIYTIHYWRNKGIVEAFQETANGQLVASGNTRTPESTS